MHLLATLVALEVARPEDPPAVLTRVVLHDMFPLLLHDVCLPLRGLLVELWVVLDSFLSCLRHEQILIEYGAAASSLLPDGFPGRATYVAEVSAASAGC